jgi:hypothetical protein
MTPNRREFVASIATVPFVLQSAGAQQPDPTSRAHADPVLDEIVADLQRLAAEFETQPSTRKATLRAMESTLGIQAAHLAAHYDSGVRASLRRRRTRVGRANFVHEIVTMAHDKKHHDVTYESVEAGLTRVEQRGLAGVVRDIQQAVRRLRRDAPDQFHLAAAGGMQFDYCSDLNWMIRQAEAAVSIACGIAILEPTPAGEAACGAITLALGLLYAQRSWWC